MYRHTASERKLYKFFISHGATAFAVGVQQVFIAWLAVGVFNLTSIELGWVQFAVLGSRIIFFVIFTHLGDAYDASRIFKFGNIALALTHMSALGLYSADIPQNNFLFLMVYSALLGSFGAFIQVSKEKLLRTLQDVSIAKAISVSGSVNHAAQGFGIILASLIDVISVELLFAVLAASAIFSFILYSQLTIAENKSGLPGDAFLNENVWSGFSLVWRDVVLCQVILLTAFNGFMHMGMFIVLMPIIARDIMGFNSLQYGALQLSFMLGATVAHFWILHKKISRPGHNLIFNLLYAALVAYALAKQPTLAGLFGLVFLWGCIAGASSNVGRLIVQSFTQHNEAGRVMAVYQLALFGCAPIGALVCGHLVDGIGIWETLNVISYMSFAVFFLNFLSRKLWDVTAKA